MPLVSADDDLAALLGEALARLAPPVAGDVLVVAQKIVSKAEGRLVDLNDFEPGARALELAEVTGHAPNFVECALRQSRRVVRYAPGVLIVEHELGFVHANAGIDRSNIVGDTSALLLPADPDASAGELHRRLSAALGVPLPVIVNDSCGRAWRRGIVGMALGCAGMGCVRDRVGDDDLFGRPLQATEAAVADELASAASLLMGGGAEGRPAVLIRGAQPPADDGLGAAALRREPRLDLFR